MDTMIETVSNQLQTILSLIILLENDMQQQHSEEIYQRVIHIIHEQLRDAIQDIEKANANL